MKKKRLGDSGPSVSVIGQGTMGIGGYFSKDDSRDKAFIDAIQVGIESGLTFIDTAEAYGAGHSEELIGIAVEGARDKVFIATKVSPENLSYDSVLQSIEGSLKRLRTEHIDLYQIHWPNPAIALEETMNAMKKLTDAGTIRYVGVSNFSQKQLETALKYTSNITSIQVEYNLFDRTVEEDLLPFCQSHGIGIIAYSPLDQGNHIRDGKGRSILKHLSVKYNRTIHQIILNWLTKIPYVFTIPKSVNSKHIKENAAASDFDLVSEDLMQIDHAFTPSVIHIPIQQVQTDKKGLENFVPGPSVLAKDLQEGETIKPIRVKRSKDKPNMYELIEGKLRYWAWVMAFDGKRNIKALVR